ncbi:acetylglutamate kinase [Streptomyces sp. NPDC053474]|uniref:amino acid kinase family protein n=1 Tax=Streptomyces sp. NPDC053474 TaxID=3365704 RepID=UPI0037D0AA3C
MTTGGGAEPRAAPPRPTDAVVVKLGGSILRDLSAAWWDDFAGTALAHPRTVLVHGWSRELAALDPAHGRPEAFVRDRYGNRSRLTTPGVLDDIERVSADIARRVAAELSRQGPRTLHHVLGHHGLLTAGEGERLWWRDRVLVELDNLVGPPRHVDLAHLPAPGHTVLVTPLARDPRGRTVNTDADRAAAALAGALGSSCLVLVTDVPHVRVDGAPVRALAAEDLSALRHKGVTGGMRKKLHAAAEALRAGVETVVIGNGPVGALRTGRLGTVIARERGAGHDTERETAVHPARPGSPPGG